MHGIPHDAIPFSISVSEPQRVTLQVTLSDGVNRSEAVEFSFEVVSP